MENNKHDLRWLKIHQNFYDNFNGTIIQPAIKKNVFLNFKDIISSDA